MPEKPITALIEKIVEECKEANASKWTITKVVKELNEIETKDIKQLRQKALQLLQQLDPKAASIYASFQRMQVRTSREEIEPFDRGNIIKSLLRETDVPRGIAEKIGREVEDKIKDLELEHINTALIREIVNVKLLEYGHAGIRNQYTRLGLPVFEVRERIKQQPYSNKAIMTEYNLLRVIPAKEAEMHLRNEIFIAGIQDFGTKPVATSITVEVKDNPKETALHAVEEANRLSRLSSWQPNISGLNLALSTGTGKKTAANAGMLFARAAKATFLKRGPVAGFNTLYLFEPDWFSGKDASRESTAGAANAVLKASAGAGAVFENAVAVDTKYKLKLLQKKRFPKIFLNCRNKEFSLVNGIALEARGLCSFTAVNLTAIALSNKGNEKGFFEELRGKIEAIKKLDELKREQLQKRPYLKNIEIGELGSAIALDSLFESGRILGETEKESEAIAISEKTLAEIMATAPENSVVTELTNKNALLCFAEHNRRLFSFSKAALEEERHLRKSTQISKNYCFAGKAGNKKELNELVESNIRLIEFNEEKG